MPLPQHGSLPLQGPARLGEGNAKPKQAMILRLSEDTLNALQNLAAGEGVEFEAGDKPGIFIRNAFFPMNLQAETTPRELFIRTTSAHRPNGPLKLNANVAGRYVVQRVLSEQLTKQIHDSSVAAAKLKNERQTIILDTPPVVTVPSKRKAPPKSTLRSSLFPPSRNSLGTPQRPTSPLPSQPSTSSSPSLSTNGTPIISREKLIHFLALRSQALEAVFNFVGNGAKIEDPAKRHVLALLREVAEEEPPPKKASQTSQLSRIWRLKPSTWLDVRPREYPEYSDSERLAVARTARTWLASMKIPEGSAPWEHVIFRSAGSSTAKNTTSTTNKATSASIRKTDTKNIPLKDESKDAFKSKLEQRSQEQKPRPSLPVKVESSKKSQDFLQAPVPKRERESSNEKEDGEISATPPRSTPLRKLPGSKTLQSQRPTPTASTTNTPQASASSTPIVKRKKGPVDARSQKRELPAPSGSADPAPPLAPPAPSQKKSLQDIKLIKTERAREKIPSSTMASGGADKVTKETKNRMTVASALGLKRKQKELEEDDMDWSDIAGIPSNHEAKKKRTTEAPLASSIKAAVKVKRPIEHEEDVKPARPTAIKKELAPPQKTKIKKEPSPLPQSRPQHPLGNLPTVVVKTERATSRSTTSSTRRRRSPIYTSSEGEQDDVKRSPLLNGHSRPSKSHSQDHTSLRDRYKTTYVEYISTFQKVVAQKNKIEKLLRSSGSSSGAESDDVEMMSAEELEKLSQKHRALHDELESIKRAWDYNMES